MPPSPGDSLCALNKKTIEEYLDLLCKDNVDYLTVDDHKEILKIEQLKQSSVVANLFDEMSGGDEYVLGSRFREADAFFKLGIDADSHILSLEPHDQISRTRFAYFFSSSDDVDSEHYIGLIPKPPSCKAIIPHDQRPNTFSKLVCSSGERLAVSNLVVSASAKHKYHAIRRMHASAKNPLRLTRLRYRGETSLYPNKTLNKQYAFRPQLVPSRLLDDKKSGRCLPTGGKVNKEREKQTMQYLCYTALQRCGMTPELSSEVFEERLRDVGQKYLGKQEMKRKARHQQQQSLSCPYSIAVSDLLSPHSSEKKVTHKEVTTPQITMSSLIKNNVQLQKQLSLSEQLVEEKDKMIKSLRRVSSSKTTTVGKAPSLTCQNRNRETEKNKPPTKKKIAAKQPTPPPVSPIRREIIAAESPPRADLN